MTALQKNSSKLPEPFTTICARSVISLNGGCMDGSPFAITYDVRVANGARLTAGSLVEMEESR
eukprot:7741500-Alexandrium_andersonii.AAC.1